MCCDGWLVCAVMVGVSCDGWLVCVVIPYVLKFSRDETFADGRFSIFLWFLFSQILL